MYEEYLENVPPRVTHSPLESSRFGFSVGRLLVPLPCNLSTETIGKIATNHDHDLLILRYPSDRLDLFEHLGADPLIKTLNAGRLVYYKWDLCHQPRTLRKSSCYSVEPAHGTQEVIELVNKSFGAYRNHYSANPRLQSFSLSLAYEEWAINTMEHPSSRSFVARTRTQAQPIGFVVAHLNVSTRTAEVILNGVEPDWQRRGVYSLMLRNVAQSLNEDEEISTIVISSQSENNAVIKAWQLLGMEELFTIETLHLMS